MAQWDVYPNPSQHSRGEIPFIVDLQSDLLDTLASRLVAPLARTRLSAGGLPRRLCPQLSVEGLALVLLPHEIGAIDARLLRHPVASLRAHSAAIVDALDAVVSGI